VLVIAVRILETIFIVGALGCVVVLALTAIEDLRTLFGRDDVHKRDDRKSVESGMTHRDAENFPTLSRIINH
jgi:hypothetical protein